MFTQSRCDAVRLRCGSERESEERACVAATEKRKCASSLIGSTKRRCCTFFQRETSLSPFLAVIER